MKIEPLEEIGDYFIIGMELPEDSIHDRWGVSWYPDVDAWCEKTFGPQDLWGEPPVTGWKRMRDRYFFTNKKQQEWFMLRWA